MTYDTRSARAARSCRFAKGPLSRVLRSTRRYNGNLPTGRQLTSLPDHILVKIVEHLLNDPCSYRNLIGTCKKLRRIATHSIVELAPDSWAYWTPLEFNIGLDPARYSPLACNSHGSCQEHRAQRGGTACELELFEKQARGTSGYNRAVNPMLHCYHHRLACLLGARHVTFSSLHFAECHLEDRGCLEVFDTAPEHKLRALVALEIKDAIITLEWLDALMGKLTHLQHLTLDNVTIAKPAELTAAAGPRTLTASRRLKSLRIINDWAGNMRDCYFLYFICNHPAEELDLSNTWMDVELDPWASPFGPPSASESPQLGGRARFRRVSQSERATHGFPSARVLSFEFVWAYLKRHRSVVRRFVARHMNLGMSDLVRLLKDRSLRHLEIYITCLRLDLESDAHLDTTMRQWARVHTLFGPV